MPDEEIAPGDARDAMRARLTRIRERTVSAFVWICGFCVFVPVGALAILASHVMYPRRFFPLTQLGCRLVLRALFIRVAVDGREGVQRGRTYLFICNHVNLFDVFVLYAHIPTYFRGIELDEHFQWFFYGWIIRRLGMIPISQSNGRDALKSLKTAREAIDRETSILILPEGGRTLDGRLQPFKKGAFLLAKKARVDIVPMAMVGAYRINRKGSLLIRPGKMALRFGRPIAYAEIAALGIDAIAEKVRAGMLELFTPNDP
jgi:1-acyl-sn-glycerol-3-phosphate acyltransferase